MGYIWYVTESEKIFNDFYLEIKKKKKHKKQRNTLYIHIYILQKLLKIHEFESIYLLFFF